MEWGKRIKKCAWGRRKGKSNPPNRGRPAPENAKAARPAGERRQRTPETPGGWLALLSKRDRMARGNATGNASRKAAALGMAGATVQA